MKYNNIKDIKNRQRGNEFRLNQKIFGLIKFTNPIIVI